MKMTLREFLLVLIPALIIVVPEAGAGQIDTVFNANGAGGTVRTFVSYSSPASEADEIDTVVVIARVCTSTPCTSANDLTAKIESCHRGQSNSVLACSALAQWTTPTFKCPYCGSGFFEEFESGQPLNSGVTQRPCQLHVSTGGGGGGGPQ